MNSLSWLAFCWVHLMVWEQSEKDKKGGRARERVESYIAVFSLSNS